MSGANQVPAVPARGGGITLEDPEPAEGPVDGDELLGLILALLHKYIVLGEESAAAVALWIVHTYMMDIWGVTPLLAVSSPTKRCGKTTLLRIIEKLVRRPLAASGISAAAIYRLVERHEPCLLIDEMDAMKENEDLRAVLNSGHTRDLAFVIRCVGEGANIEPRRFSTWCPKLLAHIGRLPGTLEDRAIQIQMRRKLEGERRDRIRRRQLDAELRPLRSQIARWSQDVLEDVAKCEPNVPAELDDRATDNWEPLLIIADAAGGPWPAFARRAAITLSTDRVEDEQEENPGLLALADLEGLMVGDAVDREGGLAAEIACEALRRLDERPWRLWGRGRDGLQPVHLARLLRPFNIKSKQVRIGREVVRRYPTDRLQEAFARYLRSGSTERATPATAPEALRPSRDGSTAVVAVARVAGSVGRSGLDVVGATEESRIDSKEASEDGGLRI